MDESLKEAIAHHRGLVEGHKHMPRAMPLESITICLLAEIHDQLMAKKAARPAKKAKTAE